MKALLWDGKPYPEGFSLKEIEKPEIKDDWLLIENKAVGICGTDIHIVHGKFPPGGIAKEYFPMTLGHEIAGVVAEVGENVKNVGVGDRVTVDCAYGCRPQRILPYCSMCMSGYDRLCKNLRNSGVHFPGGYGEYSPQHWSKVFKIPDNVPIEEAGITDCLGTAVHATNMAQPNIEDTIAIIGGGTIGLVQIQCLKASGVHHLINVSKYRFQADVAKKVGADDVVCLEDCEDPVQRTMELTEERGVDLAFDCVGGTTNVLQQCIDIIQPRGRIMLVGVYSGETSINPLKLLMKEGQIISIYCYGYTGAFYNRNRHSYETALMLLSDKKVTHKPIITHKFKIENWKKAWRVASEKKQNKAIKVEWIY